VYVSKEIDTHTLTLSCGARKDRAGANHAGDALEMSRGYRDAKGDNIHELSPSHS
jgi:hypothetical protein